MSNSGLTVAAMPTRRRRSVRLVSGTTLADRYRLVSRVGTGGIGEVWQARDLKLHLDVALKVIRRGRHGDERSRELLRQEVRHARAVVSPNVCRVFDLVEAGGLELVSMELLDGRTLLSILAERAPLELHEAQQIASQLLCGLEEIHKAGLVHRDVKPENVMVTRTGRVVVTDFGLARNRDDASGSIGGTPPYMPLEQIRGDRIDPRTDVFAAGVVLAEMLNPAGGTPEARHRLWEAIRRDPPELPDSPWTPALRRALQRDADLRPSSAGELLHLLEEANLRVAGAEHVHPYPGFAGFTERDSKYFFGREGEAEEVWRRLDDSAHLIGLIGPSGAGKSSFLHACVLWPRPAGFRAVIASPRDRPFASLARALADSEEEASRLDDLLRVGDFDGALSLIASWRAEATGAVVVIDQFEELFALNAPEVQERFAAFVGAIPLAADTHVLLAMRDDFLFRCHHFDALRPLLSDLVMLGPPAGTALERAVVQPALKCGYRFEDPSLVEEIVGEVEGRRGALPLMAFAMARLWDLRDREGGLLTRHAYQSIGGVSGALVQHAETTMARIGPAGVPIARELFRNLTTADGTRSARQRDELLSVFDPELRVRAGEVLDTLIHSRLLISYETAEYSGTGAPRTARIEIVHESLLTKWPRLAQWRAQDLEGAQFRDELRQAAGVWEQHGRSRDFVWSGAAFSEFQLWRERYPGRLTEIEEEFAASMTAGARRRQKVLRSGVAAALIALACVVAVLGASWRRSEVARELAEERLRTTRLEQRRTEAAKRRAEAEQQRAEMQQRRAEAEQRRAETAQGQAEDEQRRAEIEQRRAEASTLIALGQLSHMERESYPTAALAYAIRSLELADTHQGRTFALRALAEGPPARFAAAPQASDGLHRIAMSPGGEWMAAGGYESVFLWHRSGGAPRRVTRFPSRGFAVVQVHFASDRVLVSNLLGRVRVISVPSGDLLWEAQADQGLSGILPLEGGFLTSTTTDKGVVLRAWPLSGGDSRLLDTIESQPATDPAGRLVAWIDGGKRLVYRPTGERERPPAVVPAGPEVRAFCWRPDGEAIATLHTDGEVKVWAAEDDGARLGKTYPALGPGLATLGYDPSGRWLAAGGVPELTPTVRLVDTSAPEAAASLHLRGKHDALQNDREFTSDGRWVVTANVGEIAFWAVPAEHPVVLRASKTAHSVAFTPDGRKLLSSTGDGLHEWPMGTGGPGDSRMLLPNVRSRIELAPRGERLLARIGRQRLVLVTLADGTAEELSAWSADAVLGSAVFSPDGRKVAAAPLNSPPDQKSVRLWNLETHETTTIPLGALAGEGPVGGVFDMKFLPDGRIVASIQTTPDSCRQLGIIDPAAGTVRLASGNASGLYRAFSMSPDSSFLVHVGCPEVLDEAPLLSGPLAVTDLSTMKTRVLRSHGSRLMTTALDPTGSIVVTGDREGTIRVGAIADEEPHLLLGHRGSVNAVAVSPDGRWIASVGDDRTVRLWPMPDISKPSFHAMPYELLLERLKSLTNLRVVDDDSPTGHRLEFGPFPGWADVPEW